MKTMLKQRTNATEQRRTSGQLADKRAIKRVSDEFGDKLRLKSVLVPTDFSDCSCTALGYADFLAKKFGATVDLLHVVESARIPDGLEMPNGDWEDLMVRNALCCLKQLACDKIDELVPAHSEVRIGSAYREICAAAQQRQHDLIVIGTHGRTGLKHLFLGSTAERVVRFAPCSVLVVRGLDIAATGTLKPAKILVPVDFFRNSTTAVDAAVTLAKQFKAALVLVHVIPTYYAVGEYNCFDSAILEDELRECAQKEFAAILKKIKNAGVAAATQILNGRPATQIAEAAKRHQADLIVISTHGRTGFEHVMLGSTTEEVVRHAHCPVLALREKKETISTKSAQKRSEKITNGRECFS